MAFIDHRSHAQSHIHPFPDRLHVVTAISNPQRFRSRYELFWAFEKRVRDSGAILHVAEVAFGGRPFEVTEPGNPNHLQLRTGFELWHKENALNLLIANGPAPRSERRLFRLGGRRCSVRKARLGAGNPAPAPALSRRADVQHVPGPLGLARSPGV